MKRNLFILLIISSLYVMAQPGYVGKKTNFSLNTGYSPSFFANDTYNKTSGLKANHMYGIEIERVYSRKSSISLNYSFFRSSVLTFDEYDYDPEYDNYNPYYVSPTETSSLKCFNNKIFLSLNQYIKSPGIAFFGGYWNFDLGYEINKSKYIFKNVNKTIGVYGNTFFGFGFGKKTIIADLVSLDISINTQVPLSVLSDIGIDAIGIPNSSVYSNETLTTRRILKAHLIFLKLSLGIITK